MKEYLPFIIAGLTTAAVYALASMGLVITYSTTGVMNFAHGAIGMVAAFTCYSLREDFGLPTWLAIVVSVCGVAPLIGVVIDRLLLPNLSSATTTAYVVVSLGLLVLLQGIVLYVYGGNGRPFEPIFPTSTFSLPGVNVGYDQVAVVAIAIIAGFGLALFFRATHLGLQTRAVVNDPELTSLTGVDPRRLTTLSWAAGCAFAALAAILLAPFVGLDTAVLTLLVVQAFGAAIVGRLTSIPLTVLGATIIGVGASLITKYSAGNAVLSGLPSSLPFIVLFSVLVVSKKGKFRESRRTVGARTAPTPPPRPGLRGAAGPLLLLAAAALVPAVVTGGRLATMTIALAFVLIFSSMSLLTGLARQISLCHALFVALGATTLSRLLDAGVPYVGALLLTGLIFVPVGAAIALPASRLSGLYLALMTFGFGVLAQSLIFPTGLAFGTTGALSIARPTLLGVSLDGDRAMYWFSLLVVGVGVGSIEVVRRTRLGRVLRALGDSATGLESIGMRPAVANVSVFCLSAFLAAIAGGLLGTMYREISTTTFDYFQSLLWITLLVAAGIATLSGAVLAAFLLVVLPTLVTSSAVTDFQPILFGLAAILLAQSRNGIVGLLRVPPFHQLAARDSWRLRRSPVSERVARAKAVAEAGA